MTVRERGATPLVARGLGGRLELSRNEIRIFKNGVWGELVEVLLLGYGIVEKRIFLDQLAAVEIVHIPVFPSFIRFSYQGAPTLTGHYLQDALAENSLLMNVLDNRKFYELKDRLDQFIARRG